MRARRKIVGMQIKYLLVGRSGACRRNIGQLTGIRTWVEIGPSGLQPSQQTSRMLVAC